MKQVSTYITESKHACQHIFGMDPNEIPFPKSSLIKNELLNRRKKYKELLTVSRDFIRKLLEFMEGTPTLVMISDDEGYILEMYGDQSIQNRVHSLGIHEGTLFNEQGVGTNSISLALKHNIPVQIIGRDHYHHCLSSSACMTAPFHFYNPEETCGTITIMTTVDYAGSFHLGLISSAVDSIERELQIRLQNRRLNILHQVMVDSTQSGIIITDAKGILTEFNPAGECITGVNKQEALGKHVSLFKSVSYYINRVLTEGLRFENLEIVFQSTHSGEKRTCLFDAMPLYDENDNIMGAFSQFRDITDRIDLEKQVIAAEKLSVVGKLGAGFAHEIRNPLTSVIGFVDLLKRDIHTDNTAKHFEIISNELERIKTLVTQFVMMAKPNPQLKKECNLFTLIQDTVYLMNSHAILHNVMIEFKALQNEEWGLLIDESQIKQVIINIIQNAIEAINYGGVIEVSLSKIQRFQSSFLQIEIEDNGEGLTEEQLKTIFTPFYSSKEKGLGLGLSICKEIIESHNGFIDVTSVKDQGTKFTILLRK
jgi:PAS domain S-box-containing protein